MGAILEFIDSGHNVLVVGSPEVSDTIRQVAAEVGVDMDEKGTHVYDHFSHADADHTLVVSTDIVSSPGIFGPDIKVGTRWASAPRSASLHTATRACMCG